MIESAGKACPSPSSILSSPWRFYLFVFGWTWLFWVAAAASGIDVQTATGTVLLMLGLSGPTLGGVGFTYLTQEKDGRREYWSRTVDPKRIPATWYLILMLFVPVLVALAVLLDVALGEQSALTRIEQRVTPLLAAPPTIALFVLRVFLYGPIPEELGWRGYVLDRLQERWSPLVSSVIQGSLWALWHLPLFFFQGMFHHSQGAGSLWFWLFIAQGVPVTIAFTWIFNNTRRSTLAAILFHFMANITYELAHPTVQANLFATVLWIIAAIIVVATWAPRQPH